MMLTKTKKLNRALKEWAVAVEALTAGDTIALLRKGGIRDAGKSFEVKYPQVWLYPTYEHQKPWLLKPGYAEKVTPVESGWHPQTVTISSCGEITDVINLRDRQTVEQLYPYHIWNEQMIEDRLKWQSNRPISLLLLRVYRLSEAIAIDYDKSYGGCKSWINLVEPIALDGLTPVLDDYTYQQKVAEIKDSIEYRSNFQN